MHFHRLLHWYIRLHKLLTHYISSAIVSKIKGCAVHVIASAKTSGQRFWRFWKLKDSYQQAILPCKSKKSALQICRLRTNYCVKHTRQPSTGKKRRNFSPDFSIISLCRFIASLYFSFVFWIDADRIDIPQAGKV